MIRITSNLESSHFVTVNLEGENQSFGPSNSYGYDFDKIAVKAKSLLNEEFMRTPMNSDVAIVWYHQEVGAHAGISVDDAPYGFASFCPTIEPRSLRKAITKKVQRMKGRSSALTVQYLTISPLQKRKIEQILEQRCFVCVTCMHAVSRVLAKATNIQIPFLINQCPQMSLAYLNNLQKKGCRTLKEQRFFGLKTSAGELAEKLGIAYLIAALPMTICYAYDINTLFTLSVSVATFAAAFFKIHSIVNVYNEDASKMLFTDSQKPKGGV